MAGACLTDRCADCKRTRTEIEGDGIYMGHYAMWKAILCLPCLEARGRFRPCRCGEIIPHPYDPRKRGAQGPAWCARCSELLHGDATFLLVRVSDVLRRAGTEDAERLILDVERVVRILGSFGKPKQAAAPRSCGACCVHPCQCAATEA